MAPPHNRRKYGALVRLAAWRCGFSALLATDQRCNNLVLRLGCAAYCKRYLDARNTAIQEIWDVVQEEQLYLPLHHQILNWGMTESVGTEVSPEDQPKFKYFGINRS